MLILKRSSLHKRLPITKIANSPSGTRQNNLIRNFRRRGASSQRRSKLSLSLYIYICTVEKEISSCSIKKMGLESDNGISFGSDHRQHLFFHNISQEQQLQNNQIAFGMLQQQSTSASSSVPGNFISKDNTGGANYDLGELDQAFFLYLDGQDPSANHDQRQNNCEMRPPTPNIFPSQPMHVEPTSTKANTGLVSSGSEKSSQPSMELSNPKNEIVSTSVPEQKIAKREWNRKGLNSSSEKDACKTPDHKILRRLAQNREAARKNRLRKKAYIQQLESSRIRLAHLEQELQRARSQGFHFGGNALLVGDQGLPVNIIN
uniref:Uncharacterized protein LOC104227230 n=1 Tax=Nicotiana sylvestris TaxID=4096 RepID=A0A1U7WU26_NICSY|nr:PREDICTED: uncharacterized protein LOC104227230 [Nicotiana sylvestris]